MDIKTSKRFEKYFAKLPRTMKLRIVGAVEQLPEGDVLPLKGIKTSPPSYRLRVGKYRILLRMDEQRIFLELLDTRGDVYKK